MEKENLKNFIIIHGNEEEFQCKLNEEYKPIEFEMCKFNTSILDKEFETRIGLTDEKELIAVINYSDDITITEVNIIISHILKAIIEKSQENEEVVTSNNTQEIVQKYVPLSLVLSMIRIIHSWVNIPQDVIKDQNDSNLPEENKKEVLQGEIVE